jgi:hypothetical protein
VGSESLSKETSWIVLRSVYIKKFSGPAHENDSGSMVNHAGIKLHQSMHMPLILNTQRLILIGLLKNGYKCVFEALRAPHEDIAV